MTIDHRVAMQTLAAMLLVCAAGAPVRAQTLETTGSQTETISPGESYEFVFAFDNSRVDLNGGDITGAQSLDLDGDGALDTYQLSALATDAAEFRLYGGAILSRLYLDMHATGAVLGGTTGGIFARGQSSVLVFGGDTHRLAAMGQAVVTVTAGTIGGTSGNDMYFGSGSSSTTIDGGSFPNGAAVQDSATVIVNGGDFSDPLDADDQSHVTIKGGALAGVNAIADAVVGVEGGIVTGWVHAAAGAVVTISGGEVLGGAASSTTQGGRLIVSGGDIGDAVVGAGNLSTVEIRAVSFHYDDDNDDATPLVPVPLSGASTQFTNTSSVFDDPLNPVMYDLTVEWADGSTTSFDFRGEIDGDFNNWTGDLFLNLVTPRCDADLSGDVTVDGADLGILLGAWGTSAADLTGDGVTDGADLGVLLGAWGVCGAN
jgi:hypothetical protein